MSRHRYRAEVEIGGAFVEVEVEFVFTPGVPARGPTLSSGGEPADPAEAEAALVLTVDGRPAPWGNPDHTDADLRTAIFDALDDASHREAMIVIACGDIIASREEAADQRREAMLDRAVFA